uniref:Uncharacterized protein n=1 Tax=Salmonella phage vB_STmST19_KE12 TaxID=3161166 RepID=A0AAU8GCP9_9CAUD
MLFLHHHYKHTINLRQQEYAKIIPIKQQEI